MAKKKNLGKGDKVSWSSHGQDVPGKVEKKITKNTEAAGRTVKASKEEPQYEVTSDKSGKNAVHKPESLRKKNSG
ncbi:hypervirulence associated TUDOR domain-containing protein [Streptomyces sp. SGAir0957]